MHYRAFSPVIGTCLHLFPVIVSSFSGFAFSSKSGTCLTPPPPAVFSPPFWTRPLSPRALTGHRPRPAAAAPAALRVCGNHPEVLDAPSQVLQGPPGGTVSSRLVSFFLCRGRGVSR